MKYYCIGIKGSGMATLACLLHDLGNSVVGYDDAKDFKFTETGLKERGINIYYGHDHPIDKDTIVTYSKAFKEDHKEIIRVKELGLTIKEYNEVVGDITRQFNTIGVSGTHGKTTTTTMISSILNDAMGCNYFIGDGSGYINKNNEYFVIESDEFNRHFLAYSPNIAVATNIDLEHTECYKDIKDIQDTFYKFLSKAKIKVLCGDNKYLKELELDNTIYYGFNEDNDVVIRNLELTEDGSSFDIYMNGEFYFRFEIPLYGRHMVLNSAAAIIVANYVGISRDSIHESLKNFKNAKRRFAILEVGDTVIIDDYAHHPTEIKVTLDAVRQKYPNKKLAVFFKPNTYSRTADFYKDFASSLNIADKCFLTEIKCNREKQEDYPHVSSKLIYDLLNNGEMISMDTLDKLLEFKDNVICFMSCATIEHEKEKLIELLNKNEI